MPDPSGGPNPPFRLSMLVRDRRYRSLTLQAIVFILVMLAAAWLVNNAVENLARQGKTFDFSFLRNRAGYDIPFSLIPYSSDSTHLRAAVVGLLNTLLVSALGCLLATIVGVIAGVLRLSRNWLVARLMTVYVEIFRNIPLLLWILVILAVFTEVLPAPRDYKGESGARMILFGTVAPTNRYTAVPAIRIDNDPGAVSLLGMRVDAVLLAFVLALAAAWLIHRWLRAWAAARQDRTGERPTTWWITLALFVLPLIGLMRLFGIHAVAPEFRGFNFTGGLLLDNGFVVLVLALTLYTGAFIAEIVRAGVLAVSRGQTEAAYALGLRARPVMALVVLPQALRVIVPPLISQFLNLTKNSSLAIAVGFPDLRATLGGTTLNQTGREMESMILMMAIYLVISLLISGVMNLYNARVRLKER